MHSNNKNASYFDDDFEVTYEDDISLDYNPHSYKQFSEDYDTRTFDNISQDYDDEDFSRPAKKPQQKRTPRYNKYRPTRLAAPIQKGGNVILNLISTLIRNLTLILMMAILILMGYNFLRGSAPYGDIENAVSSNTYTVMLTAYFSVAALLIFYEIISILWAMTKARVRDKYGSHREDVGRGLTSFILLYLLSYIAFFTNHWIPESPDILKGLKGALDVFGSMHNVLFGLCLAGVISCLFRKHNISL